GPVFLSDQHQRELCAPLEVADARRVERDVKGDRRAARIGRSIWQLRARRWPGRGLERAQRHLLRDEWQPIDESLRSDTRARLISEEIPHLLVMPLRPRIGVRLGDGVGRWWKRLARRGDRKRRIEERYKRAHRLVAGRVALAARIRATAEHAVLVDRDRLRAARHLGPVADERELVALRRE